MLELSNFEAELLIKNLKERPDEMFLCDRYLAFWSEEAQRAYILPGNYEHLNEEEANEVLQKSLKKALKV